MKLKLRSLLTVFGAILLAGSLASAAEPPIRQDLSDLDAKTKTLRSHPSTPSPPPPLLIAQSLQYVPPPPPEQGQPGGTRGGASREVCPAVKPVLTALVPAQVDENGKESVWAVSAIDRPTFWLYVPAYTNAADSPEIPIEFVLQDEDGNDLYPEPLQFTVTPKPGIIEFSLPTPLETDRQYHWYFLVDCGGTQPDVVEGWIEWRQPSADLQRQLLPAGDREKVALYAANGFWYDALTELARLRTANPKDETLQADWESLLESIGLGEFAAEAIVR